MLYTDQHHAMRASLRQFIDREINPYVDEWEDAEIFPAKTLFKKMGDQGFLGVNKPEEYGGLGLDFSYSVALAEELGSIHCGGVPMAIGVHTDMATPALTRFGSDKLKKEWLAPTISGDVVACLGVSEVGAGSDVASIKTTARRDGDDYIINGGKMWTTNGTQADWMCCLVNTGDEGGPYKNKTLVIIPMNTPGVTVERKLKKLGMWSSDTAQIFFEDVRIPQRYRIGNEGEGFYYQMMQFQDERLWGSASLLLGLEDAIKSTAEYAGQRSVFKKTVLDHQYVQFRLSELQTEVEALRALVYLTTEKYINAEGTPTELATLASMCKVKGGRLGREVTDTCLQFWGGMGYMWETRISRTHRDVRLFSIGGGADEVMLSIISRNLGFVRKG